MVRGALWLVQVIGEGNTYTKRQIREAFPDVAQADRRIRDLRRWGWVLHSSDQDASLLAEDQRFLEAGVPVWDKKARRANAPQATVSAKERMSVLARDGYMCTVCGIAGGEPYPDDNLTNAVLAVSRKATVDEVGNETKLLMTECRKCRVGGAGLSTQVVDVVAAATDLEPSDRRRLQLWMKRGRRGASNLDRAWATYLRLSPEGRTEALSRVEGL